MKPCEPLEIKIPWMNVRRMPAGALEPRQIRAHGIRETGEVGKERTEQQQPNGERGAQRQRGVFPIPQRPQSLTPVVLWNCPPDRDDCGQSHGSEVDDESLLRGEHESSASAGHYGPSASAR